MKTVVHLLITKQVHISTKKQTIMAKQKSLLSQAKEIVRGQQGIVNQVKALYRAGWQRSEIKEVGYNPNTVNAQTRAVDLEKKNRRTPSGTATRQGGSRQEEVDGRNPASARRSPDLSGLGRRQGRGRQD